MMMEAPNSLDILGHESISMELQVAAAQCVAWTRGAGLMPAFLSAEIIRAAGFEVRVVECTVIAQFVTEDEAEHPVADRPLIRIGDADGESEIERAHGVVVVTDVSGTTVIFDPALSRLRHRDFFPLSDALLATTYESLAEDLARSDGRFTTAVEWVRPSPTGGRVKLCWGLRCGKPIWAAQAKGFERAARMLMLSTTLSEEGSGDVSV